MTCKPFTIAPGLKRLPRGVRLISLAVLLALWAMPAVLAQEAVTTSPAGSQPATQPATRPASAGSGILLNFKDASLQAVLEYLSESAGLIILDGARVEGRVTVLSRQPVSVAEAVALLDTVLKDKGYATILTGRTLKVVPVADALKENLPVFSGSDPSKVPATDRLVTQIIPIRYADVTKLRVDLAPLIASTATLTANKDSNSLILIDTQMRIKRIMEIIQALDEQLAGVAEVKIFQLKYANATNTSRLITELFKQDQNQGQDQVGGFRALMFGGRGGRGGGGGGSSAAQDGATGGVKQRVVATADDRTNTLVVSAPPDLLKAIEGVVKELDSDPTDPQTVFVYPLKNANAANLEGVLNRIFGDTSTTTGRTTTGGRTTGGRTTGGRTSLPVTATSVGADDLAGKVYVIADEETNALLVRAPTKHIERVKEILAELDRPIRQVLIKVLIAEVTHDDTYDLGTEFSVLNLRSDTTGTFTLDLGGTPGEASSGMMSATLTSGLSATFNALQRDGRLDVLSRPYVLASDNKEATIHVGQEVPRVTQSRTTDTGQTISSFVYQDIGIILRVTPHVNPDGLVIMSVNPVISSISDTTVTVSDNEVFQVYNTRSAETEVAVENGQTIVIGGLMEDRIVDTVRKVPWLGDLPGPGKHLFRRTYKQKVKTELLIFLTPRVAEAPRDLRPITESETTDLKAVRKAGGDGAYQEHMDAMKRGAPLRPAGDDDGKRP